MTGEPELVTLEQARRMVFEATGRRITTRELLRHGRACGLTRAGPSPAWPRVWIARTGAAEALFAGLPATVTGFALPVVAPADLRDLQRVKLGAARLEFTRTIGGALVRIAPPLRIVPDDLRLDALAIAELVAGTAKRAAGGRGRRRWDDRTAAAAARLLDAMRREGRRGALGLVAQRFGVSASRLADVLAGWRRRSSMKQGGKEVRR